MLIEVPRAFRELIEVRSRYKAFYSGRGCGKSTSFAIASIYKATQRPTRILCCREVQKTIRESVKHEIDKWIVKSGTQQFFVSTDKEITGANGSQFIFEGLQKSRAISIQSMADIDVVWVEEANTVSQVSLNSLIPTIRKNGSEIWFGWNPRSPRDPVDAMFRATDIADEPVPDALREFYDQWAIVREVKIADNPFFNEVLKVEAERDRVRNPDKYKHVWLGHYAHRTDSAVFRNWKIGTYDVPEGARPYYGADWGFSIDPTVLVRVFIFPKTRVLYIDAEVSAVGKDIDKTPEFFDSIASGPNDPLHPRKWPIMADSSRPETISYMQSHGYPHIERARKGPGSVEEGVEFLNSYDVIINPNCKRCIDEWTFYSYERDKLTDEVLPTLLDKDNHTIDACRYAVESVRRNVTSTTAFPEVITTDRSSFGDPARQDVQNPALSPRRPGQRDSGAEKGVVW